MKTLATVILLTLYINTNAQLEYSPELLKAKTDSILKEGDLLFNFEKAAWISNDLALNKRKV